MAPSSLHFDPAPSTFSLSSHRQSGVDFHIRLPRALLGEEWTLQSDISEMRVFQNCMYIAMQCTYAIFICLSTHVILKNWNAKWIPRQFEVANLLFATKKDLGIYKKTPHASRNHSPTCFMRCIKLIYLHSNMTHVASGLAAYAVKDGILTVNTSEAKDSEDPLHRTSQSHQKPGLKHLRTRFLRMKTFVLHGFWMFLVPLVI